MPNCLLSAVLGWTDFRKLFSLNVSFSTTISNCTTIPVSHLDLNVVYPVLHNINCMLQNIEQPEISITVDQSIYQIAKQIQWVNLSLADIIIRLGGFHIAKKLY